jgi:hypothetical protein
MFDQKINDAHVCGCLFLARLISLKHFYDSFKRFVSQYQTCVICLALCYSMTVRHKNQLILKFLAYKFKLSNTTRIEIYIQREFNSMCQVTIKISLTYKAHYEFIYSSA